MTTASRKDQPASKKPAVKKPQTLSLEQAAEVLGMKPVDLLRSRYRGLEPGTLGVKNAAGELRWKRSDLKPPASK